MARAGEFVEISKSFGAAPVLDRIGFHVDDGEIVVLLGASGSGKTTILRIIAGLEAADSGRVFLHGRDVTDLPARERGVGVIFQSYALFPKMTVEENIGYGLRIRGAARPDIKRRVDELVQLVHLGEHRRKRPGQLSGGQQQRVAIARALAYEPEILLFDEPFSALDAQIRSRLRREIRQLLKRLNVPAVFITHDQEEALEIADRIAVINGGRIEQIATPYEIYNRPETEYVATFLGTANLLLGTLKGQSFSAEGIEFPLTEHSGLKVGQPVKLVFRPEDARLARVGEGTDSGTFLADAFVEEITFGGATERVSIRFDLASAMPGVVLRSKADAAVYPLSAGDRVRVSLLAYRLIPSYPLSSEKAARFV